MSLLLLYHQCPVFCYSHRRWTEVLPSFLSSGFITDVTCNQTCFVFELGV